MSHKQFNTSLYSIGIMHQIEIMSPVILTATFLHGTIDMQQARAQMQLSFGNGRMGKRFYK